MPKIYFIQYLRPDGRKMTVSIERPTHIALAADKIRSHGFRFEIEMLGDSFISMTISDDEDDYACELVRNGPAVPDAVDKMISNFDLAAALKERERAR